MNCSRSRSSQYRLSRRLRHHEEEESFATPNRRAACSTKELYRMIGHPKPMAGLHADVLSGGTAFLPLASSFFAPRAQPPVILSGWRVGGEGSRAKNDERATTRLRPSPVCAGIVYRRRSFAPTHHPLRMTGQNSAFGDGRSPRCASLLKSLCTFLGGSQTNWPGSEGRHGAHDNHDPARFAPLD